MLTVFGAGRIDNLTLWWSMIKDNTVHVYNKMASYDAAPCLDAEVMIPSIDKSHYNYCCPLHGAGEAMIPIIDKSHYN